MANSITLAEKFLPILDATSVSLAAMPLRFSRPPLMVLLTTPVRMAS